MKKIYLALFSFLLLFTACKKDKPDTFANLLAKRTWELYDAQSPYYINPLFTSGYFKFSAGGQLTYTKVTGEEYKGTWSHYFHDDTQKRSMVLKVIDPVTGQENVEYYDHVEFYDDRHFKTYVYVGFTENTFWFQEKW
jgi:hypothetical protein